MYNIDMKNIDMNNILETIKMPLPSKDCLVTDLEKVGTWIKSLVVDWDITTQLSEHPTMNRLVTLFLFLITVVEWSLQAPYYHPEIFVKPLDWGDGRTDILNPYHMTRANLVWNRLPPESVDYLLELMTDLRDKVEGRETFLTVVPIVEGAGGRGYYSVSLYGVLTKMDSAELAMRLSRGFPNKYGAALAMGKDRVPFFYAYNKRYLINTNSTIPDINRHEVRPTKAVIRDLSQTRPLRPY